MSDAAERAEKAARAKALLKKRQQQKASGNVVDGGSTSRTSSPAPTPSTPPPHTDTSLSGSADIKDASVLFAPSTKDADFAEFGVLAAPSPLRLIPSPMALGRAVSSPPPRHSQHSPHSPVLNRQERRTSTPLSAHIQTGHSSDEADLKAIRAMYEAEITQLKADLQAIRSVAARESETLRSEVRNAISQAENAQIALGTSEAKITELESSLSAMANEVEKLHGLSSTQQQTITLLVNDKAALIDQASEVEPLRNKLSEIQVHLHEARSKGNDLQERLGVLEMEKIAAAAEIKEFKTRLQSSETQGRTLHEQLRALEVDLEDNRRSLLEAQHKLEDRENELRIMKEDDRVEILEQNLSASRERIGELGEIMNRLEQSLATAIQDRDALAVRLKTLVEEKNDHLEKRTKLEFDLSSMTGELEQLRQEHQAISQERALFRTELDANRNTIIGLQEQITTLSLNVANRARQQDELEVTLSTKTRKLADTETFLRSLRSENLNLLAQLEEVRPKLVELTNKTAEDEERISLNDRKIHSLEKEIEALETDLHELRLQLESADAHARDQEDKIIKIQAEKEKVELDIGEGKKAHDELESIVAHLHEELAKMKEARLELDKVTNQLTQERDSLRSEVNTLKMELDQARYASEELQRSEADSNEVIEEMRNELELLREQLFEKEQEVSNLRTSTVTRDRPGHGTSQSLSDELLGSLRDQHALDISNAHSRIRELESDVFNAKASEHALQKRVAALEDELGQLFRQSRHDGRRSTSTRPHTPSSLSQSFSNGHPIRARVVYEENLSTDIRRKRKISLGMLKARIESERAAGMSMTGIGVGVSTGSPLSRVSSIIELDETTENDSGIKHPYHRPESPPSASIPSKLTKVTPRLHLKGWDESHIFWCHACKGDLVVL